MQNGIAFREFEPRDVDWLVEAHARLYARDEGFDDSFGPLVAEILERFVQTRDASCERGWVAEHAGQRLGSIFCVRGEEAGWAKLRLFLVMPEARGLGLGKQLLRACMGYARDKGYLGMRLWTHESHTAACALYAAHGWRLVAAKPVRSFGVDLVEQTWEFAF